MAVNTFDDTSQMSSSSLNGWYVTHTDIGFISGRAFGYSSDPAYESSGDWTAASGTWMKPPSIFRLRITGTGTLQMDSKDSLGNITLLTFPLTTYTGETDKIEFPYAGDDAVAIRVTLTGTLTCEVI